MTLAAKRRWVAVNCDGTSVPDASTTWYALSAKLAFGAPRLASGILTISPLRLSIPVGSSSRTVQTVAAVPVHATNNSQPRVSRIILCEPLLSAIGDNRRVPDQLSEDHVFEEIGEEGFRRLVAAFYRQIPGDDVLGPMYPADDLEGAEQRLRDFLIFRFGGPPRYVEQRGHPRLRMRHAPFAVDQRARDRWIALMDSAFREVQLPPSAEAVLRPFFEHVATFMINRQ
ncbi:MAG: globin [Bryobacterales bacterium]|nr:globin [Bryobacterales bacterium]